MSQMSQFSDIYSSSVHEGDNSDNLLNFPSDDPQLFTPEASFSRQTVESVYDSDFIRPPQPPVIPDTLQRVGPHRRKAYILYSEMSKDDFVSWWLKTDFGRKQRMRWDGKHQSDSWKHFSQVADVKTGEPKVMCNRCSKILDHPQSSRHGTSTMNKHLSGINCRNSVSRAATQPGIQRLMRDTVWNFNHNSSNTTVLTFYLPRLIKLLKPSNLRKMPGKKNFSSLSLHYASHFSLLSTLNFISLLIWCGVQNHLQLSLLQELFDVGYTTQSRNSSVPFFRHCLVVQNFHWH